jgi:flavorubredoxin
MKNILIIYHSQSGNTENMAKAIADGAKAAGATVTLKKAADADVNDLLNCDLVAIGTPNYFSYMAGLVKDFFDRVWATVRGKMENKPYCVFGSYGGGGLPGIESVEKICNGLGMKKAFDSLGVQRTPTAENLKACKVLGKKLAGL